MATKGGRKRVTFSLPEKQPEEKPKEMTVPERAYTRSVLRTRDMFISTYGSHTKPLPDIMKFKTALKASIEYGDVKDLANEAPKRSSKRSKRKASRNDPPAKKSKLSKKSGLVLDDMYKANIEEEDVTSAIVNEVVVVEQHEDVGEASTSTAITKYGALPSGWTKTKKSSSIVLHTKKRRKPQWHPPWKISKVLSGHQGWVRCIDVDVSNEFFVTGSADRTVKIWDLASGDLKLTLTGHTDHVRGVKLSPRHPYLFSVGLDQTVKCWDLTMNKVIRSYHGHLSGVFCVDIHPALEVIMTGGRDSVCRVWDIRTKAQIQVLAGHKNTVASITTQVGDPTCITGSHDNTVRCWDLVAGRPSAVLTHHKKSVRSLMTHPVEYTFASGSGDNIKVWKCPEGRFMRNFEKKPPSIANALGINADNVCVSGHDTGQLMFWDWKTGHCFQEIFSTPQAGSIEPEAGVQALCFDQTGSRLLTAETDKAIKIWKEDETANEVTHPVKSKGSRRRIKQVY